MSAVENYRWIFLILFSHSLWEHIIRETANYAKAAHNASTFSMTEEDLKHVDVLFLSVYHFLTQQHLCWERCNDVEMPVVYQTINKNKFKKF